MSYVYAPVLKDTLPPGDFILEDCVIHYKNPELNNPRDIKNIKIRLVNYYNNHILYENEADIEDDTLMNITWDKSSMITIRASLSKKIKNENLWQYGNLYKLQLCFITNSIENKQSEWSNVIIIKCIKKPQLKIIIDNYNNSVVSSNILNVQGKSYFNFQDKEFLEQYSFDLFDKNNNLLESSGWIYYISDESNKYCFKTQLQDGEDYHIKYSIISNNYYTDFITESFIATTKIPIDILDIVLNVDNESIYSKENGCMRCYLTSTGKIDGIYYLIRSSEQTNFLEWEKLAAIEINQEILKNKLIYTDFSVESGVYYKYGLQKLITIDTYSDILYEKSQIKRKIDFEYTYLLENNAQLKLMYDNKISSFKHTVLANKVNTLGSKYPTILRNGYAYYAEFPINGLISFQMDQNNTFFQKKEDGYYFQKEKVLSKEQIEDLNKREVKALNKKGKVLDFNLSSSPSIIDDRNIYLEKIFRNKVEIFLNNGKFKLFKSATEGNFIITLMNINLQPIEALNRMIYRFSAIAYEVADFNLNNLFKYSIIKNESLKDIIQKNNSEKKLLKDFGQFIFNTSESNDIIFKIKENLKTLNWTYIYDFVKLDMIELELFQDPITINNTSIDIIITHKDDKKTTLKILYGRKYYLKDFDIKGIKIKEGGEPPLQIIVNYIYSYNKKINISEMVQSKYEKISQINQSFELNVSSGESLYNKIIQTIFGDNSQEYMLGTIHREENTNQIIEKRIVQIKPLNIEAVGGTILNVTIKNLGTVQIIINDNGSYNFPDDFIIEDLSLETAGSITINYNYIEVIHTRFKGENENV